MSDDENLPSLKWREIFIECIQKLTDKNLNSISYKLIQEIDNKKDDLEVDDQKILQLLGDITSMKLNPDSTNDPFQPRIQMADGRRSASPNDLTPDDLILLDNILKDIEFTPLKARINDLLWVVRKPKNHTSAKAAIDSYIDGGTRTETWPTKEKEFQRAINLARQITNAHTVNIIEKELHHALTEDNVANNSIYLSLSNFAYKNKILKDDTKIIATKLEELAMNLMAKNDLYDAIRHFTLSSKQYERLPDEPKKILCLLKIAECYALDAENKFNLGDGAALIAGGIFEQAINAYRRIPNKHKSEHSIDEKISSLRHRLNEVGKLTLSSMSTVSTPIDNADELIAAYKKHVSGKQTEFEALIFFSGIYPIPDYDSLRNAEIQNASTHLLSALCVSTQRAQDGRKVSQTAGLPLSNDEESSNNKIYCNMIRSFNRDTQLAFKVAILPSLHQITSEHNFSKNFILEMCELSFLIPKPNLNLAAHAIWLGFEYDFSTAIHLVAPQIENIVRWQLKRNGVHTDHLDAQGIQQEKGLSTLLDIPETEEIFGKDQVFELKAIFTDPVGPNLRNNVAHGLLSDSEAYSFEPVYAWWIFLRMVVHSIILSNNSES